MNDTIKIGDIVRSFDSIYPERQVLEGETANYVVGVVTDIVWKDGCDRYRIESSFRVFGGKVVGTDTPETYFPPVNGTPTTGGEVLNGVSKI